MIDPSGVAYGLPLKKYRTTVKIISGADQLMKSVPVSVPTKRAERALRFRKYFATAPEGRKPRRRLSNTDIFKSNETLSRKQSRWLEKQSI